MKLFKTCPQLPEPVTPDVLKRGQAEPPSALMHFFRVLCTGSEKVCDPDCRTERYIKAAAADAVFDTTRGNVKPGKHLCLGIKSMTGSRKVLEILNHSGHSVNYHTAEELETTLATNISTTDVSFGNRYQMYHAISLHQIMSQYFHHSCPMPKLWQDQVFYSNHLGLIHLW